MKIDVNKTWCFTGHRPNKLYGYNKNNVNNLIVISKIQNAIMQANQLYKIDTFISGMALGTDLWAAEIVLKLKMIIPEFKLICAIPCKNHSDKFSVENKKLYNYIIENADYVHQVTGIKYFPGCMQIRNEWMVNNSSGQIAVWDGSKGGTYNCIKYANSVGKKSRIIIHPKTFEISTNA